MTRGSRTVQTGSEAKAEIRAWLSQGHTDLVVEHVAGRRRAMSVLTGLTYDADPLVAWRAIAAMGECAGRLVVTDAEFVREHLRRLFWLLTDESGGIAWRAPEAVGEIIRSSPREFAGFVPMLVSLFDLEPEDLERFLAGTLRAVGRVGQVAPSLLVAAHARVLDAMGSQDPEVRGAAAWCAQQLGLRPSRERIDALLDDDGAFTLFADGDLAPTTVREIARAWTVEGGTA